MTPENARGRYDAVISLGSRCQTAQQIRRHFPAQQAAHFFDWLITPHTALIALLERDFEGYLAAEDCEVAASSEPQFEHMHVIERRYGTVVVHDFQNNGDLAGQHRSVHSKYRFLANRWLKQLSQFRRVLLLRQSVGHQVPFGYDEPDLGPAQLQQIEEVVSTRYPLLDFTLIGLTPQVESVQVSERSALLSLPQPHPWDWKGDDEVWTGFFGEFGLAHAS